MAILNTLYAGQGLSSSGGTITGDLTISGDLSVEGGGSFTYDEMLTGNFGITVSDSATSGQIVITQGGEGDSSIYFVVTGDNAFSIGVDNTSDTFKISESSDLGTNTRLELDENSRISLSNNDSNTSNTVFGKSAFNTSSDNSSDLNVAVGESAMGTGSVAGASYNTAIGYQSLTDITSGEYNTAVGLFSADSITDADKCTIIGASAGRAITVTNGGASDGTVAVGYAALTALTSGGYNTAVGYSALTGLTTGAGNVALGHSALAAAGVGESKNIAIGHNAMSLMDEGGGANADDNIAIGFEAIKGHDKGSNTGNIEHNIGIGMRALGSASFGAGDTVVQTGTIGIGYYALNALTTGASNTAIGYLAGTVHTTGGGNTIVGHGAFSDTNAGINSLASENNTAIGVNAMGGTWANFQTDSCVAIGHSALSGAIYDIDGTVAIGKSALAANTYGASNMAIGLNAMAENVSGWGNIAIGQSAMSQTGGTQPQDSDHNIFIGNLSGSGDWSAGADAKNEYNVCVGSYTMDSALAGADHNTCVGYASLSAITSGNANVAVGRNAANATTTGLNNVAIGSYDGSLLGALQTNAAGSFNIAIGTGALGTANENDNDGTVAIGHLACKVQAGTGGAQFANATTAVGYKALTALTTGGGNVAVGYKAGVGIDAGAGNVVMGYAAMGNMFESGGNALNYNVAIGYEALHGEGSAVCDETVAVGAYALKELTTGVGNTAVGYQSGTLITTGANNTIFGHGAMDATPVAATGNVAIGTNSMGGASSAQNASNYNVSIGNNSMAAVLNGAGENVAIGGDALNDLTSGDENTCVGFEAGDAITTQGAVTLIGKSAGSAINHNDANGTVAVGKSALAALTSGANNLAVGYQALDAVTTSGGNVAIGKSALTTFNRTADTSGDNVAIGYASSESLSTGFHNTAIGMASFKTSTDADKCVFIGHSAGKDGNVSGDGTIGIGANALADLTSGAGNVANGYQSLNTITTGSRNIGIGYGVMNDTDDTFVQANCVVTDTDATVTHPTNTDIAVGMTVTGTGIPANTTIASLNGGANQSFELSAVAIASGTVTLTFSGCLSASDNIFIGYDAGGGTWVAEGVTQANVGIGSYVMDANLNGASYNTSVGDDSMSGLTTGSYNTAIGRASAHTLVSGNQNVLLGYGAITDDSSATNQVVLGYETTGQADNSVTLGNASVTAVYMASDSGATVHAGNVVSNSNYAVEGYSTGRNVLRSIRLNITPGSTPGTNISVDHDATAGRSFNTPSLTDGTDIANNASNGSFALNDGSTRINVDVSNAIGMISESILIHDLNSSSTSEMYTTNTTVDSSDISIAIFKRGSQSLVDWRTILDAGDAMTVLISYVSSS